jgi:hypothetical protein
MYISSYATYIPTVTKTKIESQKEESLSLKYENLTENSLEKSTQESRVDAPVRKISQYPLFGETQENKSLNTFKKLKKNEQAKSAYSTNARTTSFMQLSKAKPVVGKVEAPQADILKIKSVNTYIENDNYYKITAA